MPHTSYLGFFVAFSSNVLPSLLEIVYLFYSYKTTKYIDLQAVLPSHWFRSWRPCFLITGMLYDVGMLVYCIRTEDVTTVLLAVRISIGFYQLYDMRWLIKNWIPFFVQKVKRRFIFLRACFLTSVWFFVISCTTLAGSWKDRNNIFTFLLYSTAFVICFGNAMWYLIQGGTDCLVKYRFHWNRSIFAFAGFSGMLLGIIGLIIGDGGEDSLVKTLNYHSAYVMVFCYLTASNVVVVHYFVVIFEELSWKYPNPILEPTSSSPSTHVLNESIDTEANHDATTANNSMTGNVDTNHATNGFGTMESTPKEKITGASLENNYLTKSNKVACDVDISYSVVEFTLPESIPNETVVASVPPPPEIPMNTAINNDTVTSNDGKEGEDLEAAVSRGFVSQSATVSFCDAPSVINPSDNAPDSAPIPSQTDSNIVPYQSHHRRNALAFDGITRRGSALRSSIVTHQIMMVKLKRHELVCREIDKVYCVVYQIFVWEVGMWLTQLFLDLYLQSVNTPTPPGYDGYYCQTPLENMINSAQYFNDFVFARR